MADNKIITDDILKKATENILQLMTDNSYKFVPYTQEEIQEVFDLDEVTAQSLSKVINDEFIAKNKVYSNEYTNTLLEKVKAECNQYTVEQIANSGNLKRKIVTSTSDVTDESILYLILTDSTNNIYTQYMLIDGTATPLGTTQVDLSDYLLTSDFNTTIADYAKKNETVAQNDVVSDLTTLSSNTVLSTQGVSDELDKKVDKTSIVTSISSSSTDDTVPSAKSVDSRIKNMLVCPNDKSPKEFALENSTNGQTIEFVQWGGTNSDSISQYATYKFTRGTDSNWGVLVATVYDTNYRRNIKYCGFDGYRAEGSKWGEWQKVCTTSVADVGLTHIENKIDTTYGTIHNMWYEVKNGECFVQVDILKMVTNTNGATLFPVGTLPKPANNRYFCVTSYINSKSALLQITTDGTIKCWSQADLVGYAIHDSFSYPVAES